MKAVDIVRKYLVSHGMDGLCGHEARDYDLTNPDSWRYEYDEVGGEKL